MDVRAVTAKSILTEQRGGFLCSPPYPFTHSLSAYTGCAFGATTCGMYCYAQHLPNWTRHSGGAAWGSVVAAKENAPELLEATLGRMGDARRRALRIFMSPSTDPYQPLEARLGLTRRCLEVFAAYGEPDLLVVQTRSALAERDLDLLRRIPYAWLSVSIESDDPAVFRQLRGGPTPAARFALVAAAARAGVRVQVAVSPCLPYSERFAEALVRCGARRVIVDTFVDGDGTGGARTGQSAYAAANGSWRDRAPARALHEQLAALALPVSWSAGGFCGIPPRDQLLTCVV
jgi:DNA repair photolyase